ncbi:hypothetical protein [Oceanibacterium hippocampi]|uniref:Uncharacterized protein n=1 Tax=Oceanibacterium hippocampi TaxID=745714 RepID=A0A1Y5TZL9_9PROT|nr:hypothetical protein [Oceanibacterium hippocampi]SLN77269.1 hypothetical protein OCH7691_04362 [Oceanibacterium hippocampi]
MRARRTWTAEEDAQLRALSEAGHRSDFIARRLDRTARAVNQRRIAIGLAESHARWTREDIATLRDGLSRGSSLAALSRALGRPESVIVRRCRLLALRLPARSVPATAAPVPPAPVPAPRTVAADPWPPHARFDIESKYHPRIAELIARGLSSADAARAAWAEDHP